ncbi:MULTISPECIES: alpha/beta hydrolase [Butyricimonas]|uniref:alpha/beta hydrolase n=1 Tax=Butyricimonas TaxID=574697 RepID=UPI000AFCD79D|nr:MULTISPECIES: alpha/beta hydrolase [Butyricimonas]
MMKTVYILLLGGVFLGNPFTAFSQVKALKTWLGKEADARKPLDKLAIYEKALTRENAKEMADLLFEEKLKEIKATYKRMWGLKCFKREALQMPFDCKLFGEKPEDGRSLYISMHGGGNAPEALNTQQWKNQIQLYQPEEGVYVAPRAPWDDWNMWFKPGLDEFFDALIQTAVVMMDVNPDKVYLLGYSAGGDGVWRMAPRMADRWAAASMMAGHPGEASQVNLRNVPFMIWMGENDAAYDRNKLAAVKGLVMDSLHAADPDGYIHETHIVKGKGHWMDQEDRVAIPWMAKFRRNPYPTKVVWRQEEVVMPSLYWLSVDPKEAKHGMVAIVEKEGNTFTILKNDYKRLTIRLNDELIDLEQPVKIFYNGNQIFNGKVKRTLKNIARSIDERADKRMIFSAELTVVDNEKVE